MGAYAPAETPLTEQQYQTFQQQTQPQIIAGLRAQPKSVIQSAAMTGSEIAKKILTEEKFRSAVPEPEAEKVTTVSESLATKYQKNPEIKTAEQQFDFALSEGLIPRGSKFIPLSGIPGETVQPWGYMTPAQQREQNQLQAEQDAKQRKLEAQYKIIGNQMMLLEDWNSLPANYQTIATTDGFEAMEKAISADEKVLEKYQTETGEYNITDAVASGDSEVIAAAEALFGKEAIEEAKNIFSSAPEPIQEEKEWIFNNQRITESERDQIINDFETERNRLVVEGKMYSPEWNELLKNGHPQDRMVRTPESAKRVITETAIIAAEIIVPGLYLARHWDDLSPAEKGIYIAIDVASVLPFVTAAARGAKAVGTASRTARLAAAATEVGREAVAMVRAPVDMVLHPIASVKGGVRQIRNLGENILHPRKLPEAIISTTAGTVRLRVSDTTNATEAIKIRDKLMELAARGEKPIVQIGDQIVELRTSPFMKEAGGGLATATPLGEKWETQIAKEGLMTVLEKPGMPLREQGLFVSHQPLPRFVGTTAYGQEGEKALFIIFSKETAEKAIETEKLFRQTAEMEMKFRVGEHLPAPKQKLFTRVGAMAEPVEIWLESPLTARQIAKLKALSLVEWIKAPFQSPIIISKNKFGKAIAGLSTSEVDELAKILKEAGNIDQAKMLIRTENLVNSTRIAPPALSRRTGTFTSPSRERIVTRIEGRRIARRTPASRTSRIRPEATISRTRTSAETSRSRAERFERRARKIERRIRSEISKLQRRVGRIETQERTRPPRKTKNERLGRLRIRIEELKEKTRLLRIPVKNMTPAEKRLAFEFATAWKQGFGYWAINEMGQSAFFRKPLPKWNIGQGRTPFETIKTVRGEPFTEPVTLDLGIQDIIVKNPGIQPGKPGAIKYEADPKQVSPSDFVLGQPIIRGTSDEALSKMPLGTTLKQLVIGNYKETIPTDIIDRMLSQKIAKASDKEIVDTLLPIYQQEQLALLASQTPEIASMTLELNGTSSRIKTIDEILKHLPDRKRNQIKRQLEEYTQTYAPIRGVPKPKLITQKSQLRKQRILKTGTTRGFTPPSVGVVRI